MTATEHDFELSRREMLAGLGGLTFGLAFAGNGLRLVSAVANPAVVELSAWVRITPDGMITILSPGAEMGQGSMTSLPAILAEEMDADWSKVRIEFAPADAATYGYGGRSMMIVGSRAVKMYFDDLRMAGAQVRKVLLMNAAQIWGVDAASLSTEPSLVVDPASGKRLSYGEIAAAGKVPATLPTVDRSELKARKEFRIIGTSVPRHDIPLKVNGTAQYAIDVHLPGMVYATSRHAPVHGAEPGSWNEAEIKSMPGVLATVRLDNGVAVIADRFERALAARDALNIAWEKGAAEGFDSEQALHEHYVKIHDDAGAEKETLHAQGDADAAFAGAARTYTSSYRSDLGYHAQMEPLNAVVRLNAAGDQVEVWDGTQAPDNCRRSVASALGFNEDQVTVHQCYMGGAFGRRSRPDYTVEAALIAREVGRPVKLIWTREEDIAHGMFRPQSFQCLEAALDTSGKVTGWRHCVVGDGRGLLSSGIKIGPYYEPPNQHMERRGVSHGMRLKHWRAVGHVFNVFAIESFVDEMAADQNMDPVAFRLERMAVTPRARKLFETVAEMSDWTTKRPEGRALGVSVSERSGSLGAGVAEISLDRAAGKIRVHKVWMAVDGGLIVQPDAARANIESGIVQGLSSVLSERVTVKDGAVEQSNFHDYTLLRMSEAPEEIHVEFVERDAPPSGLGEIGNPMVAAAVANAFFALTGKRLRHMPFTSDRVLEALKA